MVATGRPWRQRLVFGVGAALSLSLEVASALQRESRHVDLGAVWGRPEVAYPSEQVGLAASLGAPLSPFFPSVLCQPARFHLKSCKRSPLGSFGREMESFSGGLGQQMGRNHRGFAQKPAGNLWPSIAK